MVLNIQGNRTKPETTIGRFGLEEKDPTIDIGLPEDLYEKVENYVNTKETDVSQQTDKILKPKPRPRKPVPNIRPKIRPGSVSPIEKIAELNYLLRGKIDPKSRLSKILSGLNELTEEGQKAIKGFMDNAVGGETDFDPTKDAWCAAFVAHILSELGADPLKSKDRYDRLRADKYKEYGSAVENFADAREGDIVVFDLFGNDGVGDHVAFYAGGRITDKSSIDSAYINVVGGNQGVGEVSLNENVYTKDKILAIRRITYNDIDFDFTQEMAKQNLVFEKFIPTDASDLIKKSERPSFDKGGMPEQMNMFGYTAEGVQQEADKFVDKDAAPAKDITFKDAAKFVAELTPIIGDAMAAKEVYDELQKDDPNYFLAGALGGAAIIGLVPWVGDAAASAIRAGARKALDVGKNVEIDPTAMSSFGAGAIRKKPTIDRAADVKEAERLIDDPDALTAWIEKEGGKGKRQENPADSEAAAQALIEGSITSKEARKRIGDAIPPPKEYTADEVRNMMPTVTDVTGAMGKKARDYGIIGVKGFDLKLKKGQLIGTRLDIPAYNKYDKWVVSIHDGGTKEKINLKGSVLGYGQAIRLKNVRFGSDATTALDIARGKRTDRKTLQDAIDKKTGGPAKQDKATIARAVGEYVPEDPYKLQEMAASIIESGSKEWTQVGMNPYRGSQFYDKKTGKIIFDAEEMIQVGPLVLAKNAKVSTISDLKEMAVRTKDGKLRMFNEGGMAMDDQMEMAFMNEGGIADDGMDVDPVSGNEVPPGSLAEEVRDDIPAQLSEGVRYYGVKFFEDLRDQAKMGLAQMEADGRIGGEPVPDGGPVNDKELSEQEMAAIREVMGMAEGGEVQNPYLQQQQLYSQPRPAPIDEKRNTTITNVNPVENQMPMQSMADGGQVQGYQDSGDVMKDAPSFVQNQFNPAQFGLGYSFMGQPQQAGTTTTQSPQGQTFTVLYHPDYATNGRSKTFYLPRDNEIYQQYLGMGYTKQMPMTGPAGQGETTPTTTDTPITTDLTGAKVTTGSRRGPKGSAPTPEKVDYTTYSPEQLLEAFDKNRKTRIALTALGAVNPMIALFGQGATRAQEKEIIAAMEAKDIKPPENEGTVLDNITDFVSGLFGKDKEEVKTNVVQQSESVVDRVKRLPPQTVEQFGKSTTREARDIKPSKNISDKRKGSGMGKSTVKSKRDGPRGTRTYTSGAKPVRSETGASTSSAAKASAKKSLEKAGFKPGTYRGGRSEGGLMNKKGKKK